MKIDIFANKTLMGNSEAELKIVGILKKLGIDVVERESGEVPDFHICLGGDGSVLRAIHSSTENNVPFININTGSLGYLTCTPFSEAGNALAMIADGRYKVEERAMLDAYVEKNGVEVRKAYRALNDIVALRSDSGRIAGMELCVDEEFVTTFLCDGFIVATPTGSTAYSLSAGGPILLPTADAVVVNVICPHTLTSRPLVVPGNSELRVRITRAHSPISFSYDGNVAAALNEGDGFRVRKSSKTIKLVILPDSGPFEKLRKKLNWSGRLPAGLQ